MNNDYEETSTIIFSVAISVNSFIFIILFSFFVFFPFSIPFLHILHGKSEKSASIAIISVSLRYKKVIYLIVAVIGFVHWLRLSRANPENR